MTCLLGIGWYCLENRDKIPSNCVVRLLFQPAEEGPGGAKPMINEGVMKGVDEVYGYHNSPTIPFGKLFCPDRELMAAVTPVRVVVRGKGGHGGYPQKAIDPITCAA
jgi:hippurate hydrolase